MYFNLRLSTLQFFSRSVSKLTQSTTFSLSLFFALGSFIGFGQTFRSQQSALAANNSVTVGKPSGLAIGDLMIAQISRSSNNNVDLSNASSTGWSVVAGKQYHSSGDNRWHVTVMSKFATSTDIAATGFTFTGTNADNSMGAISAYSGACKITAIGAWGTTTDDASYSAPQITTLTANSIIIMLGAVADNGRLATDNSWSFNSVSMTERYDIEYNAQSDMGIACATLERNVISTGAGSATISGVDRNTSLLLAISGNPTVTATSNLSTICLGNSVNLSSTTNNNNPTLLPLFNGFETGDTWGYTNNTASGIGLNTGTVRTGTNSLRFRGSNKNNVDPSITFNTVSLLGYNNVQLSLAFAADNVDSGDDLFLDISYDNGVSWTSTKLIDGTSNFDCNFNATTTSGGSGVVVNANPYILTIPSSAVQVTVRIRFNESSGNNNSNDYYFIDDVALTGTAVSSSLAWSSNPSGFTSSLQNPTVTPTATTVYTLTATNALGCSASANTTVTLPTAGTALSTDNDNASCVVNQNGWVHFYHSSGRLIGSINAQGQNLGNVTMTSYVEASNTSVPACANPTDQTLMTSVLSRHWLVNPQFQPTTPVLVRWPHTQSEFQALSSASTTNANSNDDAQSAVDLKLSKYNGPNENANPLDNCGAGTTTLYSQANSGGPVSTYAPSIQGAVFYTEFSIPSFSEFWLHGSSNSSPLPVELTSFNAVCEEGKGVNVTWTTASEHNSSYFDVLKSEDGQNWRSISTVSAAGNATSIINYGIVDAEKANGLAYYKLMQYDIDGESKEYGPISSDCYHLGEMVVKAFPNPSGDEFYVELISPEATSTNITIVDAQGKSVYTRTVETEKGTNLYTFEALNVLPGMYYIQISNDLTTPNVVKHSFR